MIQRKTPLKRSQTPIKRSPLKRTPSQLKRTAIKKDPSYKMPKVSTRRAEQLKRYGPLARKFKEDNPICQIQWEGCTQETTDVHHSEGKIEEKLLAVETFVATCRNCHDKAELQVTRAKAANVSRNRLDKPE